MKCICGSGANEEIKRLRDLGQDVRVDNFAAPGLRKKITRLEIELKHSQDGVREAQGKSNLGPWFTTQGLITLSGVADYMIELQKRVVALRELWGVGIKNNTRLKDKIHELEKELVSLSESVDWVCPEANPYKAKTSSRPSQATKSREGHE